MHTDNVHSAFTFPVDQNEQANINWIISTFDIVIIDEISMITKRRFKHIRTLNEIPMCPVVLIGGDEQQQQPIDNSDGKTTTVSSILDEGFFFPLCKHFKLTSQHRILDAEYEKFLKHIRHWQLTQDLLDSIQDGHIVCVDGVPSDDEIINVILQNLLATVLTVSRHASNRLNDLVIPAVFQQQEPLATIQYDNDEEPGNLYKNMRVIITQNRDKDGNIPLVQRFTSLKVH